ncbi:MFS transporter [Anoxybacillus ayderensis]|uniref:MFS transporter n=1 Tax=Anoxybacillus ayderensis TaxID=265546 RepID=UPI0015EBFC36
MVVRLGIKENNVSFLLLVVINVFVGAMVGLERTVLPMIVEKQFGLTSVSAAISFIVSFGLSKAVVNYFAGQLADRFGRKNILLAGWMIGLFVPICMLVAHEWWVVVFANVLLGINQGLTWSMTVNMKIDIAKPTERGTAVGLNEFAGYFGVATMAAISGYVAATFSLQLELFYIGVVIAMLGMILSIIAKDTKNYVRLHMELNKEQKQKSLSSKEVFQQTTWKNKTLSSFSLAGLATNLKDGVAWGLFPLYFTSLGLSVSQIGIIVAVYPASWGICQLFTGIISDRFDRKKMIAYGMWLQALAMWFMLIVDHMTLWILGAALLGLGTAIVYPTLQAAIGDVTAVHWRASAMGVYRFWRDSGYAIGAIVAGIIADWLGFHWSIGLTATLPLLAGLRVYTKTKN